MAVVSDAVVPPGASGPNVFISWSGDRAQAVAEVLHRWLKDAADFEVFVSTQDIKFGDVSMDTLMQRLQDATIAIVVITDESLKSAWVNFEAGAIANRLGEGRVLPLLVDGEPGRIASGPFTVLQAKKFDQEGVRLLLEAIYAHVPRAEPGKPARVVQRDWPMLSESVRTALERFPAVAEALIPARTDTEMLVELVELARKISRSIARPPQAVFDFDTPVPSAKTSALEATIKEELVIPVYSMLEVAGAEFDLPYGEYHPEIVVETQTSTLRVFSNREFPFPVGRRVQRLVKELSHGEWGVEFHLRIDPFSSPYLGRRTERSEGSDSSWKKVQTRTNRRMQ